MNTCDCCNKLIDYNDKDAGRCSQPCCMWTSYYCGQCLTVTQYSHTGIPTRAICKKCELKNY